MASEADFLKAVLANPEDDAPRLIYADWLNEQLPPDPAWTDDEIESERRHWERDRQIHGRAERAERAEFIRVQVELARYGKYVCPKFGVIFNVAQTDCVCQWCALRRREREFDQQARGWVEAILAGS